MGVRGRAKGLLETMKESCGWAECVMLLPTYSIVLGEDGAEALRQACDGDRYRELVCDGDESAREECAGLAQGKREGL